MRSYLSRRARCLGFFLTFGEWGGGGCGECWRETKAVIEDEFVLKCTYCIGTWTENVICCTLCFVGWKDAVFVWIQLGHNSVFSLGDFISSFSCRTIFQYFSYFSLAQINYALCQIILQFIDIYLFRFNPFGHHPYSSFQPHGYGRCYACLMCSTFGLFVEMGIINKLKYIINNRTRKYVTEKLSSN